MSKFIHYLSKRLVLEKGFAIYAEHEADAMELLQAGNYKFVPPFCRFPELLPLRENFDLLLIRADGMSFELVCIRALESPITLNSDEILLTVENVGTKCGRYTGSIYRAKLPVICHFVYVFRGTLPSREEFSKLTRASRMLNVHVCGINPNTRDVSKTTVFLRFPRHWLNEQNRSDEELILLASQAGIRVVPMIVGAVIAFGAALLLRYWLGSIGATDAKLYGGADTLSGLAGTFISIFLRRIRRNSAWQAGLTAGLYACALYGTFAYFGATWYDSMIFNSLSIILISVMFGGLSENA